MKKIYHFIVIIEIQMDFRFLETEIYKICQHRKKFVYSSQGKI